MVSLRHSQTGISLLLLLFLILGIGTTVALTAWNSSRGRLEQQQKTQLALRQARDALIGFAAAHPSKPGYLPCPENTAKIGSANEGDALGSCSSAQLVGRLPWRTLGLDHGLDGQGNTLWYVLSAGIQSIPINSNSIAQIELDGNSNAAVALIIAPGADLAGQNRTQPTASNPPDVAQYLDLGNLTEHYQSKGPADTFNDLVLPITHDQLFRPVEARVVREARIALGQYFVANGYYPSPAAFSDTTCLGSSNNTTCANNASACSPSVCAGRIPATPGGLATFWPTTPDLSILRGTIGITPDWFQRNAWRELMYYAVSPSCIEGTTGCTTGSLTLLNSPSMPLNGLKFVVIATGAALTTNPPSQSRATQSDKTSLINYLEDENVAPYDNTFTRKPATAGTPFNDQVAW